MTFELFGTIRIRAGVSEVAIHASTLGDALERLSKKVPSLGGSVVLGDRVHRAFRASLNGERFVSDPDTPLADGDRLLLLAADVGG